MSHDPIHVFEENWMWHVDYGGGTTQDFPTKGEARAAAEVMAEREGRDVVDGPPPSAEESAEDDAEGGVV